MSPETKRKTKSRKKSPAAERKASGIPGGLSVCIITFNEEKRLPDCLKSVSFADEIIVVDSGSSDRTREIAADAGARVSIRPFDGYVSQKNHTIALAKMKWVFVIDADEILTPELRSEIIRGLGQNQEEAPVAYRVPRMTNYMGRWIRHSGWYPDYTIRLFQANKASFMGDTVHERANSQGKAGTLKNHLEHFSYNTISDHLKRIDQYSTLIAREKFKRGRKSSVGWALAKSVSKFFLMYVYKLGFLDGRQGLVIAVLGAYYNFLKYIKVWELQQEELLASGFRS